MSKAGALEMLTGTAPTIVNPSLITPDMPKSQIAAVEQPKELYQGGQDPALNQSQQPEPTTLESDRFARLSQREAKLQQEREQIKREREEARQDRERALAVKQQYDKFQELKKIDPIAAFKELGFTETDFVNWAAEQNKEVTPEEKMAQVAQKTAAEQLEAYKKEQAEAQAKLQYEKDMSAVNGYKQSLAKMIQDNAEKYPGTHFQGEAGAAMVYDSVLQYIKENPNDNDDPVTIAKDMLELYENYQTEEFLEMAKLPKYRDKLKAFMTPQEPPLKPEVSPRPTRTRTLDNAALVQKRIPSPSNKDTATVASTASKRESPSEKRARLENWLRNGKPA